MTFLNDLDDKITAIGKVAAEKTKSITDSVRASGGITAEERKIKQNYACIGRLFVQQNPQERDSPEYRELFDYILGSEEKLKVLDIQKKGVVNTQNCSRCGAAIPPNSLFCNGCGMPLNQEPVKSQEVAPPMEQKNCCSKCGAEIAAGQEFCIHCGTKVASNMDLDATELVNLSQQQVPVQKENQCPNCNAELKHDQVFCMQCGTKV